MYIFPMYFFLIFKDLTVNLCNFNFTSSYLYFQAYVVRGI